MILKMARYEHLSTFREAYDLAVHMEKIVRNFSRYHKYTLGRDKCREILEKIVKANNSRDRASHLLDLRQELEALKVTARLCHDSDRVGSVCPFPTGQAVSNQSTIVNHQ